MLRKIIREIYLFFWWWGYHRWTKETKRWREQERWVDRTITRTDLKEGEKIIDPMGTTYVIVSGDKYKNMQGPPDLGIDGVSKDEELPDGNVAVYIGGDPKKEKDF